MEGIRYAWFRVQTTLVFAALFPVMRTIVAYDRWMQDRTRDIEQSRLPDRP